MNYNEYILATHPNPSRLGKRRKTQLKNLSSNNISNNDLNKSNKLNKGNYPNIKPTNIVNKKPLSVNKLYPNLKTNKDLELKDNITKLGSDRKYNDIVKYDYNTKEKHFVPKSTHKQTLLSFKEFKRKILST